MLSGAGSAKEIRHYEFALGESGIDGYVDKVIFQSTYLYDWYTEGFNTADRNGEAWSGGEYNDRILRLNPRSGEILSAFVRQFYARDVTPPPAPWPSMSAALGRWAGWRWAIARP